MGSVITFVEGAYTMQSRKGCRLCFRAKRSRRFAFDHRRCGAFDHQALAGEAGNVLRAAELHVDVVAVEFLNAEADLSVS